MGDATDSAATARTRRSRRLPVLHLRGLVRDVLAGGTVALVSLTYTVSYAALVFAGDLTGYLQFGVSAAFLGAAIISSVVAARSSFSFAIAGPDANSSAMAALVAAGTAQVVFAAGAERVFLPTVMTAIALGTMMTGAVMFAMGRRRLGRLVRFIPYSVIGGFIAGTGWLIIRGAFTILAGAPPSIGQWRWLMEPASAVQWLPGVVIALVVLGITRRYRHVMVLPGLMIGLVAVVYGMLGLSGTSIEQARSTGWLLPPLARAEFFMPLNPGSLAQVDWVSVLRSGGAIVSLVFISIISLLLNASSVELATGTEADLDRELTVTGVANVLSGVVGGLAGFQSISRSVLNYKAGASSRMAGLVCAACMAGVLFLGAPLLSYLPKPVLGGLLLYLGLSLMLEWVYFGWFRLPRLDYAIVVVIVLVMASIGFLQGVGVGFVLASLVFALNYGRLGVVKHELTGAEHRSKVARTAQQERILVREGRQLRVLFLHGYLFFGSAHALAEHLRQRISLGEGEKLRYILLDFRMVSGLDTSALYSFSKLKRLAQAHKVTLVLTDLGAAIEGQLRTSGFLTANDPTCRAFPDFDHGLEWCETEILNTVALRRPRFVPLALLLEEFFPMPVDVAGFMRYLEPVAVAAGQTVFQSGEAVEALYFIEVGQVTLVAQRGDGQTSRLRTLGAGQVFGETSLYEAVGTKVEAVTEQRTKLYRLSRGALARMQREEPHLALALYQAIGKVQNQHLLRANRELQLLLHGEVD